MAFQAFRVEAPPGLLRGPFCAHFGAQNGSQNGFGSAPKMAPKIGPPKEAKNGRRRPSKGPQVGPQIGPKSASDPSRAPSGSLGTPSDHRRGLRTLPGGFRDPPEPSPGPLRDPSGTPPGRLRHPSGTPPGTPFGIPPDPLPPPGARAQDVLGAVIIHFSLRHFVRILTDFGAVLEPLRFRLYPNSCGSGVPGIVWGSGD